MRSKIVVLYMIGVLISFGLKGSAHSQIIPNPQLDTIDIEIPYTTVYPGTDNLWLEVWMKNPVAVAGYSFNLTLSNPDIIKFCIDDTGACIIDTSGCLVSIFGAPSCLTGDGWAYTVAMGAPGSPISPNSDYRTLFKICMDVCCIPDSMTNRNSYVYISPGNSFITDPDGMVIPFRYHMGELMVWWSVPGDANSDSLVELGDLVFLISYLYRGAEEPCVCEAADCDNNCIIDLGDIVYLVSYLYKNGPAPVPGCYSCPHENCWQ